MGLSKNGTWWHHAGVKIMLNHYIWGDPREIRKNVASLGWFWGNSLQEATIWWRQKHHGFQWHIPSWVAFDILYITWMEISRQIMPIVHRKIKHHIEYHHVYIYIKPIVCHCQIWLLECIWLFVATPLFCAVKMFELRMGQGQTRWLFSSQFWKDMNHPVLQRLAIHIPNKLNGYIIKICILMYNLWICSRMRCTVWICVV